MIVMGGSAEVGTGPVVVGVDGNLDQRRVGHHGLILCATSRHLLHHAYCPVAVVRRDHAI
jgi:hypothetical protein